MCVASVYRSLTFMVVKCWTFCFWIWDFLLLWRLVSSERSRQSSSKSSSPFHLRYTHRCLGHFLAYLFPFMLIACKCAGHCFSCIMNQAVGFSTCLINKITLFACSEFFFFLDQVYFVAFH